jgi:Zn finger protein HypA/HybF involved in hydrogenase expression
MDELMLDGNAVAGTLSEVFAVEMTTATMTCGNCGMAGAIGAMHVFRGAGIVMRCPHCDNVMAKIVEDGTRMWMNFGGMQALEITL